MLAAVTHHHLGDDHVFALLGCSLMGRLEQFAAAVAPDWLIHTAGMARARVRNAAAERSYGPLVAELLPGVVGHNLLGANDDAVVIRVSLDDGTETILKLATTPVADGHLAAEIAALEELALMDLLGDWRSKTAAVLQRGTHASGTWFSQSVVPGVGENSTDLDPAPLVTTAAAALQPVHLATSVKMVAGDAVLDALITRPIELIATWRPALGPALRLINGECRQRIASLHVALARQHGDFAPNNVLWDAATGSVSGIVDWTFSQELLPPEVDYVHYGLSLAAKQDRTEYGHAVVAALLGDDGLPLVAVHAANDQGPNDFDVRTVVTVAWLQHIAFGLAKSQTLRTNPIWLKRNIDLVVTALAHPR